MPSLHTAKTVNPELCFGPGGKHAFVYQHAHFTHIIIHCNAKCLDLLLQLLFNDLLLVILVETLGLPLITCLVSEGIVS